MALLCLFVFSRTLFLRWLRPLFVCCAALALDGVVLDYVTAELFVASNLSVFYRGEGAQELNPGEQTKQGSVPAHLRSVPL
jgi:hypothetical protein